MEKFVLGMETRWTVNFVVYVHGLECKYISVAILLVGKGNVGTVTVRMVGVANKCAVDVTRRCKSTDVGHYRCR